MKIITIHETYLDIISNFINLNPIQFDNFTLLIVVVYLLNFAPII